MDKVNSKKLDLTPIMTHNLSLTTQNIVVAFQMNRVPDPETWIRIGDGFTLLIGA
jgi:hypothetical protein